MWLNGSSNEERFAKIEREALARNEQPMALAFFPSGQGELNADAFIELSESSILVTAIKRAEESDAIIIRLFEPSGQAQSCEVRLPIYGIEQTVDFTAFEIKTLSLDVETQILKEVSLIELDL